MIIKRGADTLSPNVHEGTAHLCPDYVRLGYRSVGAVVEGAAECGPSLGGEARAAAAAASCLHVGPRCLEDTRFVRMRFMSMCFGIVATGPP